MFLLRLKFFPGNTQQVAAHPIYVPKVVSTPWIGCEELIQKGDILTIKYTVVLKVNFCAHIRIKNK